MKRLRGGKRGLLLLTCAFVFTVEDEHFESIQAQQGAMDSLIEPESSSTSTIHTISSTNKQIQKEGYRSSTSSSQTSTSLVSNQENKVRNPTQSVQQFETESDISRYGPLHLGSEANSIEDSEDVNVSLSNSNDSLEIDLSSQKSESTDSTSTKLDSVMTWDPRTEMWVDDWIISQSADGRTSTQFIKSNDNDTYRSEDKEQLIASIGKIPSKPIILPVSTEKETVKDAIIGEETESQIHIKLIDSATVCGNKEVILIHQEQRSENVVSNEVKQNQVSNSKKKTDDVEEKATTIKSVNEKYKDAVMEVDFASNAAGALILEKSDNFQGTSNLLNDDNDRYAIVPCNEPTKFVVIGLSEDILVKSVVLSNYERFSSHTQEFRIVGRSTTVGEWTDMGTYSAKRMQNQQTFHLHKPIWARYVKIVFLTHYGNEDYCTMSQISVHGSTMLQGFHEQWGEEEQKTVENSGIDEIRDDNSESSEVLVATTPNNGDAKEVVTYTAKIQNDLSPLSISQHWEDPNIVLGVCLNQNTNEFDKQMFVLSLAMGNESTISIYSGSSTAAPSRSSTNVSCGSNNPENNSCKSLVDGSGGDATGLVSGGSASTGTDESGVVVERIKKLIRTTAGAVDDIGNTIRQRATAAVEIVQHQPHESISQTTILAYEGENYANEKQDADPVNKDSTLVSMPEVEQVEALASKKTLETKQNTSTEIKSEELEKKSAAFQTVNEARSTTGSFQDNIMSSVNDTAFGKALQQFPSARCLEKLDFATFKKPILSGRSGGSGSQSSGAPSSSMEPIFKKLTDEIKALQTNMLVHDQYAKETLMCYQSIILELIITMELTNINHTTRIMKLEERFQRGYGTQLHQIFSFCVYSGRLVASETNPYIEKISFWLQMVYVTSYKCVVYIFFDRQSILSSVLRYCLGGCAFFVLLYKMGFRIVWTRTTNDATKHLETPSQLQSSNKEGFRYAKIVDDNTSIPTVVSYLQNETDLGQTELNESSNAKTTKSITSRISTMTPDRYSGVQKKKKHKKGKSSMVMSPSTPISTDSSKGTV
jgi:Sad1 / UNC-like C-terminal